MKLLINDPEQVRRLIRERRRSGGDRYDEVWNGVYVMSPLADNEHQKLILNLSAALLATVGTREGASVFAGANVSDRPDDWTKNFRCPDVLVFLPGNPAEDRGSHWLGGPDFAVEVISRRDRSRKKFDFYAKVGVRELLLVDRKPWRLELYRLIGGRFEPAGISEPGRGEILTSNVLEMTFRLVTGQTRPQIEVTCPADGRTWLA
jgi:Uma2 family endonuclease